MIELPLLDATEIRVLGALMEKCKTTPDYYPMTLNGLAAACNQKSSRNPLVQYTETTLLSVLESLRKKGLVATATGGSSRSVKYKHNFSLLFPVGPDVFAIVCLLLLRGPQTPGELNTNAYRLYEFESLEEVLKVLDDMSTGDNPFVIQLPRKAGQKEMRYMHLFGGMPDLNEIEDALDLEIETKKVLNSDLENRIALLELELNELKLAFNALMKELNG